MSRWVRQVVFFGFAGLAVAAAACWQPVPQVCPSQGTAQCSCEDGSSGIVTCFSDGTGYGPCVCPNRDGGRTFPDGGTTPDAGESLDGGGSPGDGGDSLDDGGSLDAG